MKMYIKNKLNRSVVIISCAAMMVSSLNSCANMSDSSTTMAQGTGIGATAGALLGTGIGAMAGGKDKGKAMAIGAIAGALVGGLVGNRWAASVVKKKEAYASAEQYIQANIKQMDTRIAQANKLQNQLNDQLVSLRKNQSVISIADYRKVKSDLEAKDKMLQADMKNARQAMNDTEATAEQRAKLKTQLAELTSLRNSLNSSRESLGKYARA